ncbi:MAG: D-alanyl-D-alanine carboxypeptidase [Chlamydiales bacterium]|nr:D-alanyl-D-alanine carboxypeptidase [Chlamydiales bacterium]
MTKLIWFVFILFFVNTSLNSKELSINIKSKYAVLINAKTGKVLFGKNQFEKVYPASTTKIATILYILANHPDLNLDTQVMVHPNDILKVSEKQKVLSNFGLPAFLLEYDGTELGLVSGEIVSLRTLLYALIMRSANDGANVLARFLGKDIDQFMYKMNFFLKEIGCINTQFLNPHGLFHPDHYTTPYDLAIIAKKAMEYETIRSIVRTKEYLSPDTNKSKQRKMMQSNKLLQEGNFYYPHACGIKTGYVRKAGNNLVAAANNGSRDLIAVVNKLNERSQIYRDVITMFDAAFEEQKISRLLFTKEESHYFIPVQHGTRKVKTELKEDITVEYYPSEEPDMIVKQIWYDIKAPIQRGDKVGEIQIYDEAKTLLYQTYYYASHSVQETLIAKFMQICKKIVLSPYTWAVVLLLIIIGIWKRKKYGNFSFRS